MESQGRRVRELRRRRRCESGRAAAARPGRGARRNGTRAGLALDEARLRELHDVQTRSSSREVGGRRVGSGCHLGKSVEAAALRRSRRTMLAPSEVGFYEPEDAASSLDVPRLAGAQLQGLGADVYDVAPVDADRRQGAARTNALDQSLLARDLLLDRAR